MICAMNRRPHLIVLLASWLAVSAQAHHVTDEKPQTLVDHLLAALAHPGMHPEVTALIVVPIAVLLAGWLTARKLRR
jgi:hypothetical protein